MVIKKNKLLKENKAGDMKHSDWGGKRQHLLGWKGKIPFGM